MSARSCEIQVGGALNPTLLAAVEGFKLRQVEQARATPPWPTDWRPIGCDSIGSTPRPCARRPAGACCRSESLMPSA
jgi:hypothetical protein